MIRINTPYMMLDEKLVKVHQLSDIYAGNSAPLSPLKFIDRTSKAADVDELVSYVEETRKYSVPSLNRTHLDEVMDEYKSAAFFMNVMIGENRINKGYDAGIIDIVKDAYRLTDDGWVNSSGKVVMPNDVSLEAFQDYIEYQCEVIPFLSEADLDRANEAGVIAIKDKVIARKTGANWTMEDSGRELYGDASRVLHHSNERVIIGSNPVKQEVYHATVTPEADFAESKGEFYGFESRGISAQGDAFYMTKSQNEAIRVYGNPRSFERRGAPHALNRPDLIGAVHRGMLHKISVTNDANIFDADFNTTQPTFCMDSKPSAHLLKVIADQHGLSERVASIQIAKTMSLCDQNTNQFDVYLAISEFASSMVHFSGSSKTPNPLGKIFQAMGYDGIQISEPDKTVIKSIENVAEQIENERGDYYYAIDDLGYNPQVVANNLRGYLQKIKNLEIPKLQIGHVIMFNANEDLISIKENVELPMHREFISPNSEDNFYSIEKGNLDKITTEQITQLTKESLREYESGISKEKSEPGLTL